MLTPVKGLSQHEDDEVSATFPAAQHHAIGRHADKCSHPCGNGWNRFPKDPFEDGKRQERPGRLQQLEPRVRLALPGSVTLRWHPTQEGQVPVSNGPVARGQGLAAPAGTVTEWRGLNKGAFRFDLAGQFRRCATARSVHTDSGGHPTSRRCPARRFADPAYRQQFVTMAHWP